MIYFCFIEDREEEKDATEMIGYPDMESAAIGYVEEWEGVDYTIGDYIIFEGTDEIVVVKDEPGNRKRFKIRAEQSIDYYVSEITVEATK